MPIARVSVSRETQRAVSLANVLRNVGLADKSGTFCVETTSEVGMDVMRDKWGGGAEGSKRALCAGDGMMVTSDPKGPFCRVELCVRQRRLMANAHDRLAVSSVEQDPRYLAHSYAKA